MIILELGGQLSAAGFERTPTPLGDRLPQTVCDVIDRYRHQQPLPV
jgi:hypothetical protein